MALLNASPQMSGMGRGYRTALGACLVVGLLAPFGCSSGGDLASGSNAGGSAGASGSAAGGAAGASGGQQGGSGPGQGGSSGSTGVSGSSGASGSGGLPQNSCHSGCGDKELCDPDHLGYDDNCDGKVDETCTCTYGQAHWCFKGDPSYRFAGGCADGTEKCSELGTWGPCFGGKHAVNGADSCVGAQGPCSDLSGAPFTVVQLQKGTGSFANDADPGSELYEVQCPSGVTSCPAVSGATGKTPKFQPLQSGQYAVKYTKSVGGTAQSCTYSLYIGAGGLRVELAWDNAGKEAGSGSLKGPDLDLHVHRPGTTTPWRFGQDNESCLAANCQIENFLTSGGPGEAPKGPEWFNPDSNGTPPRNWTLDPDNSKNLCFSAPRGKGSQWKAGQKGCHNPRLDLDNFGCEANATSPSDPNFCAPENINLDEMPDKSFIRIAVDYSGVCTKTLNTHPVLSIYCGGGKVAQLGSQVEGGSLGPAGYNAPVTFTPADCTSAFWIAADVYVRQGECSTECTVIPIYADANAKTPLIINKGSNKEAAFGPGYPPAP